jgi:hypothetical protein
MNITTKEGIIIRRGMKKNKMKRKKNKMMLKN